MEKISFAKLAQVNEMTAAALRDLSGDNQRLRSENSELRTKLAHFEKEKMASAIASKMEEKGIQPELAMREKIAGLMSREDLHVVAEAVELSAPQMKVASVSEDAGEMGTAGTSAEESFISELVSASQ